MATVAAFGAVGGAAPEERIDLLVQARRPLEQVASHLAGALVYLDDGAADAIAAAAGLPSLLQLGAVNVCRLQDASEEDAGPAGWPDDAVGAVRIVVIVTTLLSDAHRHIKRALLVHRQLVRSCTILCSLPQDAHEDSPLGTNAYGALVSLLHAELAGSVSALTAAVTPPQLSRPASPSGDGWEGLDVDLPVEQAGGSIQHSTKPASPRRDGWEGFDVDLPVAQQEGWEGLDIDLPVNHPSSPHVRGRGPANTGVASAGINIAVEYFPLHYSCVLGGSAFVLPAGSAAAMHDGSRDPQGHESAGSILPQPDDGTELDGTDEGLPEGLSILAHTLWGIARLWDRKLDAFALGRTSRAVARAMAALPQPLETRLNRLKQSVAFVLVDRTLDLVTPACDNDFLMDRVLSSLSCSTSDAFGLSHPQGWSMTIGRVPLRRLLPWEQTSNISAVETSIGKRCQLYGSLYQPLDEQGVLWLRTLLEHKKLREAALLVHRWLTEALRHEDVAVSKPPVNIKAAMLREMIKPLLLAGPRHAALVQVAAAVAEALEPEFTKHCDALARAERLLKVTAGAPQHSLSLQLGDLLRQSHDSTSGITLQDALLLLAVGYGLNPRPASPENALYIEQEEADLQDAIVDTILHVSPAPSFAANLPQGSEGRRVLRERVQQRVQRIRALTASRDRLRDFSAMQPDGYGPMPLLRQLGSKLHRQADLTDVVHAPSSIGGFLKSGLGRFGLAQVKPKPSDHKVIVLFVIGGISAYEVCAAREAAAAVNPDAQLIVAGTTLQTPEGLYKQLFV
eukprot:jgi/Chlat1/504/Chrsp103S01100